MGADSGLSSIGARFYDNSLGTFISVDPLLDTADTHQANAYVYSKNSPMSNSDPDGMRNIGRLGLRPSKGNSGAAVAAPKPQPPPQPARQPLGRWLTRSWCNQSPLG